MRVNILGLCSSIIGVGLLIFILFIHCGVIIRRNGHNEETLIMEILTTIIALGVIGMVIGVSNRKTEIGKWSILLSAICLIAFPLGVA